MARKVIEQTMVNNARTLINVVERYIEAVKVLSKNEAGALEISIEEPVTLIETTLTDGSKVYDIHLGR